MSRCNVDLQRRSVLGLSPRKVALLPELPFGLGALASNLSAETTWSYAEARGTLGDASKLTLLCEMERYQLMQHLRAQRFHFTARRDVVGRIHSAFTDASLH